jgi:hypothetical protein
LSSRPISKNLEIKTYKNIILSVVLHGCETWFLSLSLREEHRFRVSEKRVLRIFEPKRKKVAGGWRRLHNEELRNLYASSNIIRVFKVRRMRWEGHVTRTRDEKCIQYFGWKTCREEDCLEDLGVYGKIILE